MAQPPPQPLMLAAPLAVLLHHGEAADPTLLRWIRERMDAIFGLGPRAMVLLTGAVIVSAAVLMLVWGARRWRARSPRR